jgi:TRAP transporter TAXI family solute receptor
VAADPVEAVTSATRSGARLLDIAGRTVEQLRSEYPFFKEETIPGGTYPGVANEIRTVRVDVLLLSREGVDDNLVRRLTSAFFEALPLLAPANDFLHRVDLNRGPATPVPLHVGSALYYREREILR